MYDTGGASSAASAPREVALAVCGGVMLDSVSASIKGEERVRYAACDGRDTKEGLNL